MNQIKVPAIMDGISTLKDGSLSVRFHTQEISAEDKIACMNLVQSFGWLLFSPSEILDVPKESPHREAGDKPPSQRLRSVLYILWQQKYSDIPFDTWYTQQMEKIIENLKGRLDETKA